MLEETGMEYTVHTLSLHKNEHKTPEFLAINPNGRIPAIVDEDAGGFEVFESGAILFYLAEKSGKFLPADPEAKSLVMQWVMFQIAGVGPMQGQVNVFRNYASEKIPYAINRYTKETNRLYTVVDSRLSRAAYLAGDEYTIADMSLWPWVKVADVAGIDISGFPCLRDWFERVAGRPAVRKGSDIPPSLNESEKDRNERISKILV